MVDNPTTFELPTSNTFPGQPSARVRFYFSEWITFREELVNKPVPIYGCDFQNRLAGPGTLQPVSGIGAVRQIDNVRGMIEFLMPELESGWSKGIQRNY